MRELAAVVAGGKMEKFNITIIIKHGKLSNPFSIWTFFYNASFLTPTTFPTNRREKEISREKVWTEFNFSKIQLSSCVAVVWRSKKWGRERSDQIQSNMIFAYHESSLQFAELQLELIQPSIHRPTCWLLCRKCAKKSRNESSQKRRRKLKWFFFFSPPHQEYAELQYFRCNYYFQIFHKTLSHRRKFRKVVHCSWNGIWK